jgi:hypothetical protein
VRSTGVRPVGIAILLVCACASLWLLTGCGTSKPHLPHVTTGVTVGPKPHQATLSLSSSGDGYGVAEFVLTYPDGHKHVAGDGVLENGTSLGWTPEQMPSGRYEYTLYAVPTATQPMAPDFPSSARTEKNILSSGTFAID